MSEHSRVPETRAEQRLIWRRLRGALRPRRKIEQLIVGLLFFLVGLSVVVQVQATDESGLEGASEEELVRLLDESDRHVDELEEENRELDDTLEDLRAGREDEVAAQEAAAERLADLEILAGTAPATGRGVEIVISDPDGGLRAPTLLGVVQELRNAGAEVIQVGDVRVVASTSVTAGPEGGIVVDGVAVDTPLSVLAIGDPAVMEPALRIPGGAVDSVADDGGTLTVTTRQRIEIDAIAEIPERSSSEVVK